MPELTFIHNYTLEFTYEHCFVIHNHEPPTAMVDGNSKAPLHLQQLECDVVKFTLGDSGKGLWQEGTVLKGNISNQTALATYIGEDKTIILDAKITLQRQIIGTITFVNINEEGHKNLGSYVKIKFTGYPDKVIERG